MGVNKTWRNLRFLANIKYKKTRTWAGHPQELIVECYHSTITGEPPVTTSISSRVSSRIMKPLFIIAITLWLSNMVTT